VIYSVPLPLVPLLIVVPEAMLVSAAVTSMRWLLRLLLATQLFATAVLSGNDHANKLWTLVGCDDVDLDGILDAVDDLATAAKEALDALTEGPVQKSGKPWSDLRQAALLWGVKFNDVGDDMAEVPESEFEFMGEIYSENRKNLHVRLRKLMRRQVDTMICWKLSTTLVSGTKTRLSSSAKPSRLRILS
jgi:hypothetical protein